MCVQGEMTKKGVKSSSKFMASDNDQRKRTFSGGQRNFRERNRVQKINGAFTNLRLVIPAIAYRNKRISKVKTLLKAIQYIAELKQVLDAMA